MRAPLFFAAATNQSALTRQAIGSHPPPSQSPIVCVEQVWNIQKELLEGAGAVPTEFVGASQTAAVTSHASESGTATSTSFWTISHAFYSSIVAVHPRPLKGRVDQALFCVFVHRWITSPHTIPPHTRRAICPTKCPCLSGADLVLAIRRCARFTSSGPVAQTPSPQKAVGAAPATQVYSTGATLEMPTKSLLDALDDDD